MVTITTNSENLIRGPLGTLFTLAAILRSLNKTIVYYHFNPEKVKINNPVLKYGTTLTSMEMIKFEKIKE